jgi:hypothetical protein
MVEQGRAEQVTINPRSDSWSEFLASGSTGPRPSDDHVAGLCLVYVSRYL